MNISRTVVFCLSAVVFVNLSAAGADQSDETGGVRIRVVGPDGKPVVLADVDLTSTHRRVRFNLKQPRVAARTDAQGMVEFRWPQGNSQINVNAKGHGYGTTGLVEITAGKIVDAPLAPLAPNATMSGTISCGSAAEVAFFDGHPDHSVTVMADKEGRFTADLHPGEYWGTVQRDGLTIAELRHSILLSPGEVRAEIEFQGSTAPRQLAQSFTYWPVGREKTNKGWATGMVRDEAGNPIAGATVYAAASFHAGLRMGAMTANATTGPDGRYSIQGEAGLRSFSATLVAHKAGMAPATAWITATPDPASRDFILTTRGGKLDVRVFVDQKPAPGATVVICREGETLPALGRMSARPSQSEVVGILQPMSQTGADGIAHFENLRPGLYEVIAALDERTADEIRVGIFRNVEPTHGIASAVAVRAGESVSYQLNVYAKQDKEWPGVGQPFGQHIIEPYNSAGLVAYISARSAAKAVVAEESVSFQTGSVSVELRDVEGRPARGVVAVGKIGDEPVAIGSADDLGRLRFEGVPCGQYVAKVDGDGRRAPDLRSFDDGRFPTDSELAGRVVVPFKPIAPPANADLHILLQAQPAGYVRGKLRPSPGRKTTEYKIDLESDDRDGGAQCGYHRLTGEFVAGPFVAGKKRLIIRSALNLDPRHELRQEIDIEGGKVTEIEIQAPALRPRSRDSELMTYSFNGQETQGLSADTFAGHVYLSDGKTPAYGATLFYLVPGDLQPHVAAVTDVAGNIEGRRVYYLAKPQAAEPPGGPDGAVIVAMLPGSCGAAIVDVDNGTDKPLSIVLPKPINLHGVVTFSGAKLSGKTGRFRVLAKHQGLGKLDGVLSIWATPQADGNFELAGMTPGTYQVQATLDDSWTSNSVTVATEHPSSSIALDIAPH